MNNRDSNKRSNIQKTNPKIKSPDDSSFSTKKELVTDNFLNIIFNKYKILTFSIFISVLFLIVTAILSFWIYNSNLKHDQLLAKLSNQLETMPKPISQGRLGLIIKKSNDELLSEINKEISFINKKIKETESLINTFPKPISEGKIGLIFDKKIKKINTDLEKRINQIFSSKNNPSSNSKENEKIIKDIKNEFENIKKSLKILTKIIGSEDLEKSLSKEILDLKLENKSKNLQTNSSASIAKSNKKKSEKIEDLFIITKQFADYAYKAIKEDLRINREDGLINSFINNFQLIFVQRSLSPQDGDSVDSILSRAEHALSVKNYDAVIEELNKLPNEASKIMDEWRKKFEVYLENNS